MDLLPRAASSEVLLLRRVQLRRDFVYGTAFALIAIVMLVPSSQGGWGMLLLWPSASFLVVSVAYLSGDVRYFGKRPDGTRHWLAGLALWPYLAFTKAVWSIQVALSQESAVDKVNDGLHVSRRLRASEVPADVTQVCDLTCEFLEPPATRNRVRYMCFPLLDAGAATPEALVAAACALPPPEDGRLLVHCANGHGRTGMFAAVWLVVHGYATSAAEAMQVLQSARPAIALRRRQQYAVIEAVSLIGSSTAREDRGVVAAATTTRTSSPQQQEYSDRERTEDVPPRTQTEQESHLNQDYVPWWAIAIMLLVFVQFCALSYFAFRSLYYVWQDFDETIAAWYALLVFAVVGVCLSAWLVMALYDICKGFIALMLADCRKMFWRCDKRK